MWQKKLQVETARSLGWFLYSFRAIDTATLEESLLNDHGISLSFRFQHTTIGRSQEGKIPDHEKIRALFATTPGDEYDKAKKILRRLYTKNANFYPLGLRMRFIPHDPSPKPSRLVDLQELR